MFFQREEISCETSIECIPEYPSIKTHRYLTDPAPLESPLKISNRPDSNRDPTFSTFQGKQTWKRKRRVRNTSLDRERDSFRCKRYPDSFVERSDDRKTDSTKGNCALGTVFASCGINGASVVAICQLPFAIRINN